MKIFPLPARGKMIVIIDSKDDALVLKCLDFDMGIFSYSDGQGNHLFVAKSTDVDVYITDDLYKKVIRSFCMKKDVKVQLLEAGIQRWEGA